jgi:hypothetical protein
MADRGAQGKEIVFIVVLALAVAAVILHAGSEHDADGPVHLSPVPSAATGSSPVDTPAASSTSPTPTPPSPRTLSVGPALCGPSDYTLTRQIQRITAAEIYYYVTATYTGTSHCLLSDYPQVTSRLANGSRRPLNPAGGVITGYGQPPPAKLAPKQPLRSYLLVTTSAGCPGETLRDVRLESVLILRSLSHWCIIDEAPWGFSAGASTSTQGAPACRPYNLTLSHLSVRHVSGATRYTLTVSNKSDAGCVLGTFPHLSARTPDGSLHELTVGGPKGTYPAVPLGARASATTTLRVRGTCRSGTPLTHVMLENLAVGDDDRALGVAHWCTLTEAYWRLVS